MIAEFVDSMKLVRKPHRTIDNWADKSLGSRRVFLTNMTQTLIVAAKSCVAAWMFAFENSCSFLEHLPLAQLFGSFFSRLARLLLLFFPGTL
jgi:hypothetical protein